MVFSNVWLIEGATAVSNCSNYVVMNEFSIVTKWRIICNQVVELIFFWGTLYWGFNVCRQVHICAGCSSTICVFSDNSMKYVNPSIWPNFPRCDLVMGWICVSNCKFLQCVLIRNSFPIFNLGSNYLQFKWLNLSSKVSIIEEWTWSAFAHVCSMFKHWIDFKCHAILWSNNLH